MSRSVVAGPVGMKIQNWRQSVRKTKRPRDQQALSLSHNRAKRVSIEKVKYIQHSTSPSG